MATVCRARERFLYSKVSDNALEEHFDGGPSIFQCIYELLYRIKGAIENGFSNLRWCLKHYNAYRFPGFKNRLCQTILTTEPQLCSEFRFNPCTRKGEIVENIFLERDH